MADDQPRSRMWYYAFPAHGIACGPVSFAEPKSERQMRQYLRNFWEMPRLPRGTELWSTSQAELDAMVENNRKINEGMPCPD